VESNNATQAAPTLNSSVLVLNRFYMPVHVIQVRRALRLLYCDFAEVIHVVEGIYSNFDFSSWMEASEFFAEEPDEHDEWIRGVGFQLQVPRVIRLSSYDKVPRQSLRFNRRNVFARDDHTCQYCARAFTTAQLSLDHVLPRSRGGDTSWENVVCCCLRCNTRKSDRTPKEANMRLLSQPKKPRHSPLMKIKLENPKYAVWRNFISHVAEVSSGDVA
jgi:5-methylcytosine-specific restriction endonuclease McrA